MRRDTPRRCLPPPRAGAPDAPLPPTRISASPATSQLPRAPRRSRLSKAPQLKLRRDARERERRGSLSPRHQHQGPKAADTPLDLDACVDDGAERRWASRACFAAAASPSSAAIPTENSWPAADIAPPRGHAGDGPLSDRSLQSLPPGTQGVRSPKQQRSHVTWAGAAPGAAGMKAPGATEPPLSATPTILRPTRSRTAQQWRPHLAPAPAAVPSPNTAKLQRLRERLKMVRRAAGSPLGSAMSGSAMSASARLVSPELLRV